MCSGAAAREAPTNGRIGYLRPLGGNEPPYGHLFTVNPDGSGNVDLTPDGYTDIRSFAWSPNGRRVAFSAIQDGDHDPELFVMSATGGNVRRLTAKHLPDFQPSWSPGGRWIAFTSIRTGLSQIYRMRAGHSVPTVTPPDRHVTPSPVWLEPAWRAGIARYRAPSTDTVMSQECFSADVASV